MRQSILNPALILFLLLASSFSNAEIHKWVDENGKTHFGDRPPAGANSSVIEVKINTYESPNIEALRDAIGIKDRVNHDVIMYSAEWCGVCKKAKRYFTNKKIPFKEKDIDKSQQARKEFDSLGGKGVPVILVGDTRLNGFSKEKFESIYNQE